MQDLYLQLLEKSAAKFEISGNESLAPALIMLSVLVLLFLWINLRREIKFLAYINFGLVLVTLSSFQACLQEANRSGSTPATPAEPILPPQFSNLDNYFSQFENRINVLKARTYKKKTMGEYLSPLPLVSVPECQNYKFLNGFSSGVNAVNSCDFISEWDGPTGIKAKLQTCTGADKHLVMDLKLDYATPYSSAAPVPTLYVNHGEPFPLFIYCIEEGAGAGGGPKISILNPAELSYEIVADTQNGMNVANHFSSVTKVSENDDSGTIDEVSGWFTGSFIQYENGQISTKATRVRLAKQQRDIQLPLADAALPQVKVIARPPGISGWDPTFNIGIHLVDQWQRLIRGAKDHGPVNVATRELTVSHSDLNYSGKDSRLSLSIGRTHRSQFHYVGMFGWNWDFMPRRKYYSFITPTGDYGHHEFLFSGEGRTFYVPENNNPGPFWTTADPKRPNVAGMNLFHGKDDAVYFDLHGRMTSQFDRGPAQNLHGYIYDGNLPVMMVDQHLLWQGGAEIKGIYQTIRGQLMGATTPTQFSSKQATLYNVLSGKNGDFLFLSYNASGYVQAIVDKMGNFLWYTYDKDRLTKVERFGYQRDIALSSDTVPTTLTSRAAVLYEYNYETAQKADYPGLLLQVKDFRKPYTSRGVLDSITYEKDVNNYGGLPVVKNLKVGGLQLSFSSDRNSVPAADGTLITTTVTDNLNRTYKYYCEDNGFAWKIEAPTESSNSEVIYEGRMRRDFLRVSDAISRGVEHVFSYNGDGQPDSYWLCADRHENGSRIVAELAELENGVVNLADVRCEGASRQTTFGGGYDRLDFIFDFQGIWRPRMSNGPVGPDGVGQAFSLSTETIDCSGLPGTSYWNGTLLSQRTCHTRDHAKGGRWFSEDSKTFFEDNQEKSFIDAKDVLQVGSHSAYGETYSEPALPDPVDSKSVAQFGFRTYSPVKASRVYTPTGNRDISDFKNFQNYDAYGNPTYAVDSWGTENASGNEITRLVTFYDYRFPTAQPQRQIVFGIRPIGDSISTKISGLNSGALVGMFRDAANADTGGANTDFRSHVEYAFESGASKMRELIWVERDGFGRVVGSKEVSGDLVNNIYNSLGLLERTKIIRRLARGYAVNPATPQSNVATEEVHKVFTYDTYERLKDTIISMKRARDDLSGWDDVYSKEVLHYRADGDRGVMGQAQLSSTLGAGAPADRWSWVVSQDHAGRVLEARSLVNGGAQSPVFRATRVTYEYNPFGEVSAVRTEVGPTTSILGSDSFVVSMSSVTRVEREPNTGTVLAETTQNEGASLSVDTREYRKEYSNFDQFMRPRRTLDVVNQIETTVSGVVGKDQTTEQRGPNQYRTGNPSTTLSRVTEKMDGCGNSVEKRILVDENPTNSMGENIISNEISYGFGGCRVVYQAKNDTTKKQFFGYDTQGKVIATGDYYQGATPSVGDQYSANLMNSFLSSGDIYSFNARGSPRAAGFVWYEADAGWENSIGDRTMSLQFVGDKSVKRAVQSVGSFGKKQGIELKDGHSEGNYRFWGEGNRFALGQYQLERGIVGGTTVNFQQQELDPVAGTATKIIANRMLPMEMTVAGQSIPSKSLQLATLDGLGREISTVFYEQDLPAGTDIQTPLSVNENALVSSFEVVSRVQGSPEVVRNAKRYRQSNPFTETSNVMETTTNTYQANSDLPYEVLQSRADERQIVRTGTSAFNSTSNRKLNFTYDAYGRPLAIRSEYTNPDNYGGLDLVSSRAMTYNQGGQLKSETITLNDGIRSNTPLNTNFGTNSVGRAMMPGGDSVQVQYEYPSSTQSVARYANFTVTYDFTDGSERSIKKITILAPNNQTYKFDPKGYGQPYVSNRDKTAGKLADAGQYWAPIVPGIGLSSSQLAINNLGNPPVIAAGNYEPWHRGTNMTFKRGSFLETTFTIAPNLFLFDTSHSGEGTRFRTGAWNGMIVNDVLGGIVSPVNRLPRGTNPLPESQGDNHLRDRMNCDNLLSFNPIDSIVGQNGYGVNAWNEDDIFDLSSRFQLLRGTEFNLQTADRLELYGSDGKPAVSRFTVYRKFNYANSTNRVVNGTYSQPQERVYRFDTVTALGVTGMPELEERVVSYRGPGTSPLAHNVLPRPQRAQQFRRFFGSRFDPDIGGSAKNLLLVERIQDAKAAVGSDVRLYDALITGTPNLPIKRVYFYAGYSSPVKMATLVGTTWKMYDIIYDNLGNVRSYLEDVPEGQTRSKGPDTTEVYMAFGGSVVERYPAGSNLVSVAGGYEIRPSVATADGLARAVNDPYELARLGERPFGFGNGLRLGDGKVALPTGNIYDPHTGTLANFQAGDQVSTPTRSKYCLGTTDAILQAQNVNSAEAQTALANDTVALTNSAPARAAMDRELVEFRSGLNGLRFGMDYFTNYYSDRFLKDRSAEWAGDSNLGQDILGAVADLTCVSSLFSAFDHGNLTAKIATAASCGLDFVPGVGMIAGMALGTTLEVVSGANQEAYDPY